VDCSGLVHLAFRVFGVVLPRDAHDQASAHQLRPVPLDEARPGDLYFFAEPGRPVHHVGFASQTVARDGTRWMLHAPGVAGIVEDAPMSADRVETLVSAGRVALDG
jgi:cell wall-associated NlpC family hydrolase